VKWNVKKNDVSHSVMRICIHRGTKEIGGTCVEIKSQGKRIVLDVGLPLDAGDPDDFPLHPIKGFDAPDPSLLGVVISHPHQDHYGLAYRLPKETTFLIGEAAEAILAASGLFSPAGVVLQNVVHLRDRQPIPLGPFTITPFLVDHSAYDSYAVLVEADGRRLFYSGDFRSHGRKASLIDKLIADPPKNVDVLLMEGTCIGRENADRAFPTEAGLEGKFVELFQETAGMPLIWCSGQNIDRIVTVFKACKRAGRQFIIDVYTAEILRATGNDRIPQASWNGIKVFLPTSQKRHIILENAFDVSNAYRPWRIFSEELSEAATRSVILFRPSMVRDLEKANCVSGASVIISMWGGYIESAQNRPFVDWTRQKNIRIHHCHTSGHASVADLKRLRNAFPNAVAVPVHLADRGGFADLFENVVTHEDGEWWTL
jgi:ribonuclease J